MNQADNREDFATRKVIAMYCSLSRRRVSSTASWGDPEGRHDYVRSTEGVYNFSDNSFDGTMAWPSGGGLSAGLDDIRKLGHSQRSRQTRIVFGAFALPGIVSASLLKKQRY